MVPLLKATVLEFCTQFLYNKRLLLKNCYRPDYFYRPGIRFPGCSKLGVNWKNCNYVKIFWNDVFVIFFEIALFLLSILVNSPNFMSRSSLVLELWQFPSEGWGSKITQPTPLPRNYHHHHPDFLVILCHISCLTGFIAGELTKWMTEFDIKWPD